MSLPSAPVFLLGQGYQGRARLRPVGDARAAAGESPPGLLLSWGDVHDEGVQFGASNAGPLSPVLAHPGARKYERSTIGGHKTAASWVQRPRPQTIEEWAKTMDEAVAAQQALGLPAIILPSRKLDTADWPDGVQDALDAARQAVVRYPVADIFAGLILDDMWISDVRLRRTLLNQFTDLPPELGAALHVLWSNSTVPHEATSLAALRTVVEALAQDGRRVLLIEAGLLGWLSLAWGTWGFTAGLSQASWLRSTAEVRRAKGQHAPRVSRYFEASLLHHVRQVTHQRLARETGYVPCACSFCGQLAPATATTWDHNLAEQHGLYTLATLTERVAAPRLVDRHARVRSIVDSAQQVEANVSFRLTGDSRPTQLSAWRAEL